jgi:N-acetylneuraminic acid mutarotase
VRSSRTGMVHAIKGVAVSRKPRYRFPARPFWTTTLATAAVLASLGFPLGGAAQANTPGWQSLAPMLNPRYGAVAGTLDNGQIIVAGGELWEVGEHRTLAETELYTPSSNTWTTTSSMLTPTVAAGSAVGADGRFYVFGGFAGKPSSSLEIYDPSSHSWSIGTSLPSPIEYDAGAALPNGDIVAIGGQTSEATASTAVEEYDPTTSTWSGLAPLPLGCQSVGAVTGTNGDVYVFGGACSTGNDWSNQLEIYDPATNMWANGPSMPKGVGWPAVALASKGRIYVAGGYNAKGFVKSVFIYKSRSGSWVKAPSLPFGEYQQDAVSDSAGVVVLGGCGGPAATPKCPSKQAILHPVP